MFQPKCFPLSVPTKPAKPKAVEGLGSNLICFAANKRESRLPAVASISCPPIDAASLQTEFGSDGVTFSEMGDTTTCVVKMLLENGSVAKLMLPSGLITSYKPLMWHGGTVELLHTLVSEGENGGAVIHGGVSLAFTCDSQGILWSPSTWVLRGVKGDPRESIQVELSSKNAQGDVEVKHLITLGEDYLGSEIIFSNSNASPLKLMGSIISHLTVSTPEATYAIGLEGSDYSNKPPVATDFSLLPPEFGKRNDPSSGKLGGPLAFVDFFSRLGGSRNQNYGDDPAGTMEEKMEGEENDNYKRLEEEMSRLYINAPRSFTLIDRGRRNSVVVRRDGFNELYMYSPGSSHEWYGKYAYICVGQAAMQQPLTLASHSKWKGQQYLCNPNL